VALYLFFITLSVVRAVRFRESLRADLHDPTRAFGFFTAIAGTNVIATALVGLGMAPLALVLFGIGALLWLVLGYGIPFAAVLGSSIRPVVKGVNGTWFVWVVAAQSVAVVASSLALELPKSFPSPGLVVALTLVAVIMWAVGLALYIACALFVGMRVLLHRFGPEDLDAPYWGDDGAPWRSRSSPVHGCSNSSPLRSSTPRVCWSAAPRRCCGPSPPGSSPPSSSPVPGGTSSTVCP
jgi:hypothetical protein